MFGQEALRVAPPPAKPSITRVTRNNAFTLAEVLVTLGIIGVVASMTMPTLINNQRKVVLENQLKKQFNVMSQALNFWKQETGVIGLYKMYATYNGTEYVNSNTFKQEYMSKLKAAGTMEYKKGPFNFNKTKKMNYEGRTCTPTTLLPDGSSMCVNIWSGIITVTTDINGPNKNPNAWGYDIFTFIIDSNNEELRGLKPTKTEPNPDSAYPEGDGYPCSLTVSSAGNGLGCAYYALTNVCPNDDTKKYWECIP